MRPLVYPVTINKKSFLGDYRDFPGLTPCIEEIETQARLLRGRLKGHRLWMINSTEQGGGVAEMLPTLMALFNDLKIPMTWLVMQPQDPLFFIFTKKLHHLLHGRNPSGGMITPEEKMIYEQDSRKIAKALAQILGPHDLLVVHDPQPLAAGAFLNEVRPAIKLLWRCHIGTEFQNQYTKQVWEFLTPYLKKYRQCFFSHPDYIPLPLKKKSAILHPAIDPLSDKNIWLSTDLLVGILERGGLHGPRRKGFKRPVLRLTAANKREKAADLNPITTPIVLQISRFDHLKGFIPLMKGFLHMKQKARAHRYKGLQTLAKHMIRDSVLILAGPELGEVADDPEPVVVLQEILEFYRSLPKAQQRQIYILLLPMASKRENALICNALQRSASVIVQNSIREGFGLTVAEALWKEVPVLASAVGGIRLQIRDKETGLQIKNPHNAKEVGQKLLYLLTHYRERMAYARRGWLHAMENFLTPVQLKNYLHIFKAHFKIPLG